MDVTSLTDRLPPEAREQLGVLLSAHAHAVKTHRILQFYPETGPLRRELYPKHMEFFAKGAQYRERCFMAANRIGKALKHGTRVMVPGGWTAIEDLQVGDLVIGGDGLPTHVVGVYPQGEVDLFAVTFDGRHTVETCAEHRWLIREPRARYRRPDLPRVVRTTADLAGYTLRSPVQRPTVPGIEWATFGARIEKAYALGCLLGDGTLGVEGIRYSAAEDWTVEALSEHFRITKYAGHNYGVIGAVPWIRSLGLLGCRSHEKFIPAEFKAASAQTRLGLLRGLMDTDGSINAQGATEYATCSPRLAEDVEWLALSLGFKVRVEPRQTFAQNGNGLPSYRLHLIAGHSNPFWMPRKASRWRPVAETTDFVVHSVEPSGRGEATCIEVAYAGHTFVIEHGIVTHNSEGAGGYETTLHLTGEYPAWWPGRRFDRATYGYACGKTNETTRDIVQTKLFGKVRTIENRKIFTGTGLVPGRLIGNVTWKQGVADLADTVQVKHVSGEWSECNLKSYAQGRGSFEGTERDWIWLDEEPPVDIYGECLMRTATTNGLVYITFTPLEGATDVVRSFMPAQMLAGIMQTFRNA